MEGDPTKVIEIFRERFGGEEDMLALFTLLQAQQSDPTGMISNLMNAYILSKVIRPGGRGTRGFDRTLFAVALLTSMNPPAQTAGGTGQPVQQNNMWPLMMLALGGFGEREEKEIIREEPGTPVAEMRRGK
jgi:hypothetical protein